jgi:hypothetical protein
MGQRHIMTGGSCTVVTFRPQVRNFASFAKILNFCKDKNVSFSEILNAVLPNISKCLDERTSDDEPLTTNFDMGDISLRNLKQTEKKNK